jgi:hypothetical protein
LPLRGEGGVERRERPTECVGPLALSKCDGPHTRAVRESAGFPDVV